MIAHGRYDSNDNAGLVALFSGLTIDEKHDILSLNFMQIRYRVYLNASHGLTNFFVAKNKFDNAFVADGGARLRRLIRASTHGARVWEIPKGRKKSKVEVDIHCAIREFQEETGFAKSSYKIYPSVQKSFSHVDGDTRYTNVYFLAAMHHMVEPRIDFGSQDQIEEIGDIRWMSIEDIRRVDINNRLENFVRPLFNYVKKHGGR